MSEHLDQKKPQGSDSAGSVFAIVSLVLGILGAIIGYRFNWLLGVVLVLVCIVCGILALRRGTPLRWAAFIGIAVGVFCLVVCVVVVSIFVYQTQHMNELLSYS